MRQVSKSILSRLTAALCALVMLFGIFTGVAAADVKGCPEGMSQLDCAAIFGPWENWIPESGSGSCSDTTGGPTLPGGDNKEKAFNYFVGQGLDQIQAAAVVGNLIVESSLNTSADQPNGLGMGIAQWSNPGRWNQLEDFAAQQGRDKFDLGLQLDFMWHELETGYATALANTKKQTNIEDATAWFMGVAEAGLHPGNVVDPVSQSYIDKYGRFAGYENPGTPHLDLRITAARSVQESFGDGGVSGTNSVSGGCTTGSTGSSFNLASFNICYSSACPGAAERMQKSVNVIKQQNLEVVGLQEVREDQYGMLKQALGDEYGVFPDKYVGSVYASQNPIIYDKSRFEIVDSGSKTIRGYQVLGPVNEDVDTQIRLRDTSSDQEFYLINSHEPVGNDERIKARFDSASMRAEYVKDLAEDGIPIFLSADWNAKYTHEPNQQTYQGKKENHSYCVLTNDTGLWDAYDAAKNKEGTCPSFGGIPEGDGPKGPVDHIYMSTGVKAEKYDYSTATHPGNGSDSHNTLSVQVTIPGSGSASCGGSATLSVRDAVVCLARAELELWTSGQMKPGHDYYKYSEGENQAWCADFASWIYKEAGYPIGPSLKDWRVPAVQSIKDIGVANKKFHYHAAGSYTPKPGDIVIHLGGQSHVNIVTSVNTNTSSLTMIGGNQTHGSGGSDNNIVSEYTVSAFSVVDGITGYVSPD